MAISLSDSYRNISSTGHTVFASTAMIDENASQFINTAYADLVNQTQAVHLPSFNHLTPKQQWLLETVHKKASSLEGLAIRVITDQSGNFIPNMSGNIIGIISNVPKPTSREILFKIQLIDSVVDLRIFQIEPIKEIPIKKPTKASLLKELKLKQEAMKKVILLNFTKTINKSWETVKTTHASFEQELLNHYDRIKYIKSEIKRLGNKLKTTEKKDLNWEYINKILLEIKSNKKVEEVYFSNIGNLIVITKPLQAIDSKTDKEIEGKVWGRFIFRIQITLNGIGIIDATNLDNASFRRIYDNPDYRGSSMYSHPNLNGLAICWGENKVELSKLISNMNLYGIVDLMIMFFSLTPHDNGHPYIDHAEWWATKSEIIKTDLYANECIRKITEPVLIKI